jgi:hypothetical protein
MNAAFLGAYLVLIGVAYWRVRSLAWLVLATAGSIAVFGASLNFIHDRAIRLSGVGLQWILLAALVAVLVAAFVLPYRGSVSVRRQFLAVLLPVLILLGFFILVTTSWTEEPAFLRPVSFLMGNANAEDNARWLDFTAQWASGEQIYQPVPIGGPLQLFMTFIATVMAVISEVTLGGLNQVAVAANSVIYGEYALAIMAPIALATLAEAKFRPRMQSGALGKAALLPVPALWLGMGILSVFSLAVIAYGHLTLQFTFLIAGLWSATFLAASRIPRARLVSSLAAAASMTVWLPLNVIAVMVVVAWAALYISRLIRFGARSVDWVGFALLALVSVGVFQPVYSSLYYLFISSQGFALPGGFAAGGVSTGVFLFVPALAGSILFAATGGTEQVTAILGILAVASVIAAAVVIGWQPARSRLSGYRRFATLGAFTVISVSIFILDFWSTGSGPNYGSMKFSYLLVGIVLATTAPIALMALNPERGRVMTMPRWVGLAAVIMILAVDTLLPRAGSLLRPEMWSPPIPFNNTSGSYWWPAEVNGTGDQPIAGNPMACVYLPEGSLVPTAIVPSGLSDPQRVYACTRQLSGLAGLDAEAQPIVDWLRREWFTNEPAWAAVYDSFANLPDYVLDRPVILLDDGSNVKGIETMRALLARYPKELAIN